LQGWQVDRVSGPNCIGFTTVKLQKLIGVQLFEILCHLLLGRFDTNTKIAQFKVIFIGDSAVGKTSLMNALLGEAFNTKQLSTSYAQLRTMRSIQDGRVFQFQLWDTAGTEAYRALTRLFFHDVDIVILCYAVNDRASFNNLEEWRALMNGGTGNMRVILVATKNDLRGNDPDRVSIMELEEEARKYDYLFIEASALTREGLDGLQALMEKAALTVATTAGSTRVAVVNPADPPTKRMKGCWK
jgi:small GTP-binding protein